MICLDEAQCGTAGAHTEMERSLRKRKFRDRRGRTKEKRYCGKVKGEVKFSVQVIQLRKLCADWRRKGNKITIKQPTIERTYADTPKNHKKE